MLTFYNNLFCGVYAHLLRADKAKKNDISSYFAYSTILVLIFIDWILLFSFALLAGEVIFSFYSNLSFGLSIIIFLFLFNWYIFIRKLKYVFLLKIYMGKRDSEIKKENYKIAAFIVFLLALFVFAVVMNIK